MGSVVFDFDSTLVPCESLEVALARAPGASTADLERIAEITRLGMEGKLAFRDSLEQRLAIARPSRDHLEAVGLELAAATTVGSADVVDWLHAGDHEVWIVSGGFQDVLLPVARALGIPDERVQGVRARWAGDGSFEGLAEDGFAVSKIEGVQRLRRRWMGPSIGVGDGATDLALRDAGLVDAFIAYTEHARRGPVVGSAGVVEVTNMAALRRELEERWR